MRNAGIELLIDFYYCRSEKLGEVDFLRKLTGACISAIGVTFEREIFSVTLNRTQYYAVISESHIGVDAYPSRRSAEVSIFTCGKTDPIHTLPILSSAFGARRQKVIYYGPRPHKRE